MAVLVAPVGVVVIIVGQPVSLVGRGALGGTLGGVSPCGESERMAILPFLLDSEEIRQRIVECSLHISAVGPAVGQVGGDGPSAAVESRGVGIHASQGVVAVGGAQGEAVARSHASCPEVVVVRAAHVGHGEVVTFEWQSKLHVSGLLVQSAHQRVSELSRLHVVHGCAIDEHIVVFLVERTVAETDW